MTVRRASVWFLAVVVTLAVACGPSVHKRAIQSVLTTLNTTRDAFVTWDRTHQGTIVRNATELVQAKRDLLAYRDSRERVVLAFEAAYKALAVAALEPEDATVTAAVEAVRFVEAALRGLGMDVASQH